MRKSGEVIEEPELKEFNTEAEIKNAPYFGPVIFALQQTPESIEFEHPQPATPSSKPPTAPKYEALGKPPNAFFLFKKDVVAKMTAHASMPARLEAAGKLWWGEWNVRREYEYKAAESCAAHEIELERRKTEVAQYWVDQQAYEQTVSKANIAAPKFIEPEDEPEKLDTTQTALDVFVSTPASGQPAGNWTSSAFALDVDRRPPHTNAPAAIAQPPCTVYAPPFGPPPGFTGRYPAHVRSYRAPYTSFADRLPRQEPPPGSYASAPVLFSPAVSGHPSTSLAYTNESVGHQHIASM